jgi:hypothetical protein
VGRQFSGGGESAVLLYLSISGENNVRGISLTITPIPRGAYGLPRLSEAD